MSDHSDIIFNKIFLLVQNSLLFMEELNSWGKGQIYTTATFQGENLENSNETFESKFLNFLQSFRINSSFIYRYFCV
jgi:hypothetical protein